MFYDISVMDFTSNILTESITIGENSIIVLHSYLLQKYKPYTSTLLKDSNQSLKTTVECQTSYHKSGVVFLRVTL